MTKDRKKNRLKNYDYSRKGYYYVTICVHPVFKGQNIFGIINNYNEIILNKYGEIVNHCWQDLTNHYHNCLLDTYVIMPDHFHGIVQIINIDENAGNGVVDVGNDVFDVGNGLKPFPTVKHYGLSEIIRGFKTFSSRGINKINHNTVFRWQKSYYDHIVRDDYSLNRIRKYIINNPAN